MDPKERVGQKKGGEGGKVRDDSLFEEIWTQTVNGNDRWTTSFFR